MRYKKQFQPNEAKSEDNLPPSLKHRSLNVKRKSLLYQVTYENDRKRFEGRDAEAGLKAKKRDKDWDPINERRKIQKYVENEIGVSRAVDAGWMNKMAEPKKEADKKFGVKQEMTEAERQ